MEDGRLPLRREAAILQKLYGERLNAYIVSTSERDWLVMNVLSPLDQSEYRSVTPDWIKSTISSVDGIIFQPPTNDSLTDVIQAAEGALRFLADHEEIRVTLFTNLSGKLDSVIDRSGAFAPHICHGDLGPRNVMTDGTGLILLDWEDMLTGFRSYDWICWLSFFANRHLLNRGQLLRSGLLERDSRAILLSILLLRCELAVRCGSVAGNFLSTHDRLSEALWAD